MIGVWLVLYPWNWYGGHLVLVHLSISPELWHESYKDILMGQIPLVTTIQTVDPDHSYFTQKSPNFISSGSKIVKRLRRRQYDPLIIETTIGLVLGPCTALCRLFLKHCTLTNKAVGTIWRALSKPPQRRQGSDLHPLWLLCSLSAGQSIACPSPMSLYIFLLYYIYHLSFTCIDFYDLSAWGGCWFVVYIRRCIYKFLNVCPFDYTVVAVSGKVGP